MMPNKIANMISESIHNVDDFCQLWNLGYLGDTANALDVERYDGGEACELLARLNHCRKKAVIERDKIPAPSYWEMLIENMDINIEKIKQLFPCLDSSYPH